MTLIKPAWEGQNHAFPAKLHKIQQAHPEGSMPRRPSLEECRNAGSTSSDLVIGAIQRASLIEITHIHSATLNYPCRLSDSTCRAAYSTAWVSRSTTSPKKKKKKKAVCLCRGCHCQRLRGREVITTLALGVARPPARWPPASQRTHSMIPEARLACNRLPG